MATFIEAQHPDVEGTALLPSTAFRHMPGWAPVDSSQKVPSPVDGTVDEVLAAVGDDPVKARVALTAEQASTKPRTTLVEALSNIADPNTES